MVKYFTLALIGVLFAAAALAAPPGKPALDFADPASAIELKLMLQHYHASSAPETDGSLWYMITFANSSLKPAARVLVAGEPADAALHFFPRATRPAIQQVASSDGGIVVERARAFGRHAFRVIVPPATSAALAIRFSNADAPPSLLAWNEPALVAHNRQLAVFVAAVAGLIAAALAITAGLAVMTMHPAPRWAAFALLAALLGRISTTGMLDSGWVTAVGGPYGLGVMFSGLALATGIMLADVVAPLENFLPQAAKYRRWGLYGLIALSLFAFLGVPGATLLLEPLIVLGTAGVTAYLVHQGRSGMQAARVIAPSAAVFSLVAVAGAVAALGGFSDNPAAPVMIGGFVAAGAVLLALAISAGEGIAILPGLRPEGLAPAPIVEPRRPQSLQSSAALQAIGASHQGVFDLDFQGHVVRLSAEACALIGLPAESHDIANIAWIARIHPDDRETYQHALADYRTHPGLAFRVEFRVRGESGRYPWLELRATMLGEGTQADRCLGLMADVTARKDSEGAVADRTLRDTLTGLGNRVALMEELDHIGNRLSAAAFAVLDIDRFKSIHTSLGDTGADEVLAAVAARLTKRFEGVAKVFRVGGDAFALIFPQGGEKTAAIGADLIETCTTPYALQSRNVFAQASAGIVAGHDAFDPFELLKNAELALLQAKRAGGACARVYSRDLEALAPGDAVALETDLRHALEDGQLDIFYQPIVRLSDNTVAGFEALLRWRHPTKGLISPVDFIGHSEQTGLIVALGRFALERAANEIGQWQKYFPIEPPLFVSVNVSRRQLRDTAFEGIVGDVLTKSEIKPATLKLEVTESAVAANDDARAILARIRALGAGIAIDDFGTGLSTLSQLKDIPFDTVKIDKSFLAHQSGAHDDEDRAAVLGSIVSLAHELRRAVVVEGVENERDAKWLKELGCEYAQGFYFSAALPSAEALNYIALHYQASGAPRIGGEA